MPADQVETAFERCQLRDGAAELIADLRRSDVSVAIITGSFERGVETALERADIAVDHLVANRLVLENRGTDRRSRRSAARGRKGPSPRRIAVAEDVDLDRTIAVGSGSTDLPMLRAAGTAVGFEPEPVVEQ